VIWKVQTKIMLHSNRLHDLNHSFTNITVLATKATTTNDVVRSARHQTDHVCNDMALPAVTQHFDISANGVWKCVRTLYMHAKHLYNTVLVTSHTLSTNVPIIK